MAYFGTLSMRNKKGLYHWHQMKEDTIENINRDLLIKMINQYEFLGVFFCKFLWCIYASVFKCDFGSIF